MKNPIVTIDSPDIEAYHVESYLLLTVEKVEPIHHDALNECIM